MRNHEGFIFKEIIQKYKNPKLNHFEMKSFRSTVLKQVIL
jgi:hypothetical protein